MFNWFKYKCVECGSKNTEIYDKAKTWNIETNKEQTINYVRCKDCARKFVRIK